MKEIRTVGLKKGQVFSQKLPVNGALDNFNMDFYNDGLAQ
jgi:hypothetical protein